MKRLIVHSIVLCALIVLPALGSAQSILVFDKNNPSNAFVPHTIVLTDCRAIPVMAVQFACAQTSEDIVAYGPLPGTCANYSDAIARPYPEADAAITALLDETPLVLFDTLSRTVAPYDLSIAAACAGFGTYSGGGGGGQDRCPDDPDKTEPGLCGCGVSDVDSDADQIPDCHDARPTTPIAMGDLNNDGTVDLIDSIAAMQVLVGSAPSSNVHKQADLDDDQIVGLGDVIHILQTVAGERP